MNDSIAEALGLDDDLSLETSLEISKIKDYPIVSKDSVENSEQPDYQQHLTDDYIFARNILLASLEEAQRALKDARIMNKEAPCPKSIEATSKLLKTISDINDKLMKLHNDIFDRTAPKKDEGGNHIDATGGNVIVASTDDILKMLKNSKD